METTRGRVGKILSDMFHIKNGLKEEGVLPLLLFNFALGYAIQSFQVNQNGFKLHGTHQCLVHADDGTRETGVKVFADIIKYMFRSPDQNAV
jgi:hypothetical protein